MLTVQMAVDGQGKRLITNTPIQRGEVFHKITDYQPAIGRTYTSVQIDVNGSIEEFYLAHLNHSCAPNVLVDTAQLVLRAARNISPGEALTFFYPSTEWEMAEPFPCLCNAPNCLGTILGAKDLSLTVLGRYFINRHIGMMALEHLVGPDRVLDVMAA
jgi:hypothetical protein